VRGGPEFVLPGAEPGAGKVRQDGDVVELSAGELTLRVDTSRQWCLEFTADGRVLTSVGERGTGFVTDGEGRHHMLGQLALGVGELVYGLGERFTPFVRNGQGVDIWQADGGTSSEQTYKNVPFHLTNRPPGTAPGLGARPVADYLLHHRLRGHGGGRVSPGLARKWPGTAGQRWDTGGRNRESGKSSSRLPEVAGEGRLPGICPGQAPFLVLLEKAQLLGGAGS
jgi:hypothetical protein